MKLTLRLAIQAFVAAITKKVLGSHVYALIVTSENGLFAVDPEDYGVGISLRVKGQYGLNEIEGLNVVLR